MKPTAPTALTVLITLLLQESGTAWPTSSSAAPAPPHISDFTDPHTGLNPFVHLPEGTPRPPNHRPLPVEPVEGDVPVARPPWYKFGARRPAYAPRPIPLGNGAPATGEPAVKPFRPAGRRPGFGRPRYDRPGDRPEGHHGGSQEEHQSGHQGENQGGRQRGHQWRGQDHRGALPDADYEPYQGGRQGGHQYPGRRPGWRTGWRTGWRSPWHQGDHPGGRGKQTSAIQPEITSEVTTMSQNGDEDENIAPSEPLSESTVWTLVLCAVISGAAILFFAVLLAACRCRQRRKRFSAAAISVRVLQEAVRAGQVKTPQVKGPFAKVRK